jgi:hypothetical protein
MTALDNGSRSERALNWLALRLVWLIVRAADRLDRPGVRATDLILARLTLAFVSVVGWLVDRLPRAGSTRQIPPAARDAAAHVVPSRLSQEH